MNRRGADNPTPGADAPGAWTTRSLLAWMGKAFRDKDIDSPRLLAEMLLAHVLGCDRLRLYTDADRPAAPEERARLRALVTRALRHEPVQYLVGEGWFFSLPFLVDRRVLIPRPSTETIVEHALQGFRAAGHTEDELAIADVCTGSGCVAIALLRGLPRATAIATDLSEEALEVARANAERHGVADRVRFVAGDLLDPIRAERPDGGFDALTANPPYIPDHEWSGVAPNVAEHEPELALRAGPDALRLVRPIVEGAADVLAPGGALLVEIAACSADDALALAAGRPGLEDAGVEDDFEGLARVIRARRTAPSAQPAAPSA